MGKISLIIQREYLSRVKKKSFIIMTLIGPLLMSGIIFARLWLGNIEEDTQLVQVVDETHAFAGKFENGKNAVVSFSKSDIGLAKKNFYKEPYNILLYIPYNILEGQTVQVFYKKQPPMGTLEFIKNSLKNSVEDMKLEASGIDRLQLEIIKTDINVVTSKLESSGKQQRKSTEISFVLGLVGSLLIYFFIFLYGAQVMRGVIEEKTSRIVEVIISSVKPFELMMGKIIGIAMVGLTQFLLWMVLTFSLVGIAGKIIAEKNYNPQELEQNFQSSGVGMPGGMNQPFGGVAVKPPTASDAFAGLSESINLPLMLGCFLFYFLGGYLLYGALFAAIGSAVDSEADTQQFMLPITIPMILALTMSQVILTNPESSMAFWFSIIPLTSPIIMMVRLPFGVPAFDLILSMSLLVVSFIGATWLSGKIYRTGILMYGKKNSYKELWKWLFYKG